MTKAEDYEGWLRAVQKDVGVDTCGYRAEGGSRTPWKNALSKNILCGNPWAAACAYEKAVHMAADSQNA